MADSFDEDKQRATDILNAARAQADAMTQFALNAWRRPYADLYALYGRLLNEPMPPVQEWPQRAAVASILLAYNALEYQTASARAFLKACEAALPKTPDCIEIDRQSEAGGPIAIKPHVPVDDVDALLTPNLACPGAGVIPARFVELELEGGQLMFSLVGLTEEGGPQPLAMGTYVGDLRNADGHHVALLKVQVVRNVP